MSIADLVRKIPLGIKLSAVSAAGMSGAVAGLAYAFGSSSQYTMQDGAIYGALGGAAIGAVACGLGAVLAAIDDDGEDCEDGDFDERDSEYDPRPGIITGAAAGYLLAPKGSMIKPFLGGIAIGAAASYALDAEEDEEECEEDDQP
ncbi:hypothetical protein HY642_03065 [Candidatus Woesearchaeota archaeon]|nr:hypothetical protein [Candidatus Woesearchaeota archaeon]